MEHGLLMAPFPTDVEMLALDRRSEMPQGGAGIVRAWQWSLLWAGPSPLGPIRLPRWEAGGRVDPHTHLWGRCIWSNLRGPGP